MKKKVLIIGAGDRVRNTILPALLCLSKDFEVYAIVARRARKITVTKSGEKIQVLRDFTSVDFQKVDLVIVAVTLSAVPEILWRLPRGLTIMLDTPVLAYYHFLALFLLLKFKKVYVSEEFPLLPPLVIAKNILKSGKIGHLKKIEFLNFGYEYHALAAIKYLSGQYPLFISNKRLWLTGSVKALLMRPQDYQNGKFKIIGDNGSIANFKTEADYVISQKIKNGIHWESLINGTAVEANYLDKCYQKKILDCLFEKNIMKSLKVRGFMELLTRPNSYSPLEGFADQIEMQISTHLPLPF